MKNVLVFDLDDTLFPEHQYVRSGFRAVDSWLEREEGVAGFLVQAEQLFKEGVRGNVFNLALDRLFISYEKFLIQKLVQVYRRHKPELKLYDDAEWALKHYNNNPLGLITDGYLVSQKRKIESLSLEKIFQVIICSDEFGRDSWKPSIIPYQKLMSSFGFEGWMYTYIGDNPQKDFVAARKLGWNTIMVARNSGEYSSCEVAEEYMADVSINTLYELEGLVLESSNKRNTLANKGFQG